MAHPFDYLDKEQYISLTTFRANGEGVPTPVWFAREGDKLYVWTQANSYKVKRLRNNPSVEIAPCTVRGEITGPKISAQGRVLPPDQAPVVKAKLNRKYGLLARLFDLLGRLSRSERVGLEITTQS